MTKQSTKIKALLSLNDMSLKNQRDILIDLNSLLSNCTQDLFDFELKFEDAGLLEKLLIQIIKHNSSLIDLSKGFTIKIRDKDLLMDDMTAIYSVARLQIETFVNLSYLFFIDFEVSQQLKVCVYKIQGLNQQISLTSNHPKDFEPIAKMRNELAGELNRLRNLEEFKTASRKQKNKYIKPRYARLKKPEEIYSMIKIGDLSRTHSLYSNHIHSEYISIRQLNSSIRKADGNSSYYSTVLLLCSRITSLVITNLVSKYKIENGSFKNKTVVLGEIIQVLKRMYEK
ncbi:hypothetical protein [Aquimarina spinulae]|uniref:hypothetical protein n=1 Tax=Aquimarina spinulae TaxID=1192023 RepID=UPI000D5578C7|nr:hypothetical protein [Aquimarina spinulae]